MTFLWLWRPCAWRHEDSVLKSSVGPDGIGRHFLNQFFECNSTKQIKKKLLWNYDNSQIFLLIWLCLLMINQQKLKGWRLVEFYEWHGFQFCGNLWTSKHRLCVGVITQSSPGWKSSSLFTPVRRVYMVTVMLSNWACCISQQELFGWNPTDFV